ncbi:translation initiation factor IF-2 [Calycina marina]|uniref:Translation initiation factor IF-2, mitochondrial n=1 Tax=Calycina marina TaxID=1763456 RepID=A0A9P7Z227_9HELO|nr:translation initiation factor IF-2 [Calycina marina]
MGTTRRPSHIQRRYLQSSRPSGKPPAAGATETQPQAPAWGRPAAGATWGKPGPGFGTNLPAWPTFSPAASDGKPAPQTLLPHEQKAREIIEAEHAAEQKAKRETEEKREVERQARGVRANEWQPRQLPPMHKGPGPASTRSGRYEPRQRVNHEERLEMARAAAERRKAHEARDGQRQEEYEARQKFGQEGSSRPFQIKRFLSRSHELGESVYKASMGRRLDAESQPIPQWNGGHLRQRQEPSTIMSKSEPVPASSRPVPPPENAFLAGRAQREAEAATIQYIPLGGSAVQQGIASVSRPDFQSPPLRHTISSSGAFKTVSLSRNRCEVQRATAAGVNTAVDTADAETRRKPKPKDDYNEIDMNDEVEESRERRGRRAGREARPPKRFEAESYTALPKGKDRDKSKRRGRFRDDEDVAEENGKEAAIRRAEDRKRRKEDKAAKKAAAPTSVLLPEYISVSNLAMVLKIRTEAFIEKMEELGYEEITGDHILNSEDAGLIAMEYNFEAIIDRSISEDLHARAPAEDLTILPPRPPVVTIMGHVDHGKTTLLDWLRKSSVAATEHGGITQHIGAFSVPMPGGKVITFLDTPGHAAFLSMRQRGANVTDIVILVVAADDSVKPQTIEAINHAKSAKVPIIVAINKIDKDDVNIERVKQDLARHGVDVEDFGGDVQAIGVSGKTGQGMDELEEAVVTLSEILDMRAENDGPAEGWVLEASIKSMGKVATVLVRRGTMRPGDFIVAGQTWARIRCLRNEAGIEIDEAGPGKPVEIDGWREQPVAGDEVLQAPDEAKAKSVMEYRLENAERDKLAQDMDAINEFRTSEKEKRDREKEEAARAAEAAETGEEVDAASEAKEDTIAGPKQIYFIVKGDVSGSVEAVIDQISALGNKEVQPHILRSGVGAISEFDIEHAAAAKGHVINFNTVIEPSMIRLAAASKVSILDHTIIYKLVDDVKAELSKHLKPLISQRVLGEAEISQIFMINVKGRQQKSIAGCKVRNGTVARIAKVRVLRKNEKVFDGSLASLKNVKKDVQEMKKGSECGIGFDNWFEFQVGDLLQSYDEKEEKRYL